MENENVKKNSEEQSEDTFNKELGMIRDRLKMVNKALFRLGEVTGANKRANEMREEISKIGWNGVLLKYHPDVNHEDPAAHILFQMYKFLHQEMINKNEEK